MHLHGVQAGLRNEDQEIHYTVCKPVYETKTREICYTVLQAGLRDRASARYTVCKPVYETKTHEICYTVCKPVYETRQCTLHGVQAGLRDEDA